MAETRNREAISADYQAARDASDAVAMRRFQNEEACLVLLAILERLAAEPASFIHRVALKGGILMAGELHSPRSSADIDATTGRQRGGGASAMSSSTAANCAAIPHRLDLWLGAGGVAGWPGSRGKASRMATGSGADETALHAQSQGRRVAVLGRMLRINDAALEPRDE